MPDATDPLRKDVLAAVRARGAPQVAREVDVHHQTLRKYLGGGTVRRDVLWKLESWYSPPGERVEVRRGLGVLYGSDA